MPMLCPGMGCALATPLHTRRYREHQPELAVRRLLDGFDVFILRLGVLRQCFRGGDWLLDVNLPGPKLVSQGANGFRN